MQQYLVKHAIENVWCNPKQDNQFIFAAHKITKPYGELNTFYLMNRKVKLPQQGRRYHVFQVGQIHPNLLGLLGIVPDWTTEKWIRFSEAINTVKVHVDIYTSSGTILPRYKSYYMFSNDRNLVFAIELDAKIPLDYEADKIYVRLYSNAYFMSHRGDAVEDYLYNKGMTILNGAQILTLQNEFETYKAKTGFTSAYCNGYIIDAINPINVKLSDTVEFLYDSSVKKVVTFTLADLPTFTSELDSKNKYLLHHNDGLNDTIDYHDDVEIHILAPVGLNRYKGYYYHRNNPDSHRMVTHRDYSIIVDYVNYIANKLSESISDTPLDINQFKIQLIIREAGYYRPLIYDNSRIFELYKLDDASIVQAMVGVNSTMEMWKAPKLEINSYTQLMREQYKNINMGLVQKAYGYNSISKIVGDTPSRTYADSGLKRANLPIGLYEQATVYEYDVNGHMLDFYPHAIGYNYECTNNNAVMVEAISGVGSYRPDVKFGTHELQLPEYHNYRIYRCYLIDGIPNNQWEDITDSDLYTIIDGKAVWTAPESDQFLMLRTDGTFLAYDIYLSMVNGNLFFTLAEEEDRGDGFEPNTLPVPMGELDLFLNGKSLIRGLDYIVKFPTVYILNKSFLNQPANSSTQKIHVRHTGFCKPDLSFDDIEDFGFIEHGYLSNNNKFDIRDDKVLRITVNGSIKHRDDMQFSEEHDGISVSNPINGLPYQIKDIVVPLKQLVDENTYSLRAKSMDIDQKVVNYMTIKLPQPDRDAPSSIYETYKLVSPFFNRLIDAVKTEYIETNTLMQNLSDMNIIEICREFEYLLDFDPINEINGIDTKYVEIHPHRLHTTVDVNAYQYRFLMRVVKLYADGLIDLSPFLVINS